VGQSVAIGAGPRELGGAPPLVDTPSIDPCELASRIYPFEEPCKFGFVLPIYNLRLYILQPHLTKELYSLPCGLLSRARLRISRESTENARIAHLRRESTRRS
jgi:hypothetical protein